VATPIDRATLLAADELDGETIADLDGAGIDLSEKVFRRCRFERVRLAEAVCTAARFEDCTFAHADLTLLKVERAAFHDVRFDQTKLMGVDFSGVKRLAFSPTFEKCVLTYATFADLKMRGVRFVDCKANDASFAGVDLTEAVFAGTDLTNAKFIDTILVDADLSTSWGYRISPQQNRLQRTRFSEDAALALVEELGVIVPER
jgi:fluoroquinolone resistance protein